MKLILTLTFVLFFNFKYSLGNPKQTPVSNFNHSNNELNFVENKGQFTDESGNDISSKVFFKLELKGLNVWITEEGLVFQSFISNEIKNEDSMGFLSSGEIPNEIEYTWYRTNIRPLQAVIRKEQISFVSSTGSNTDYYTAQYPNGIKDAAFTKELLIKHIYPGIDWKIYIENKDLKHEFIVEPGANYQQINLAYEGFGKFNYDATQIAIENPAGRLQEGKLLCFTGEDTLKSKMIFKNIKENSPIILSNQNSRKNPEEDEFIYHVSYEINNALQHNSPLVIDPPLSWATLIGGNDTELGWSLHADNNFLWLGGYTSSLDFPTINAGGNFFQGISTGDLDIVFSQFDINTNQLLWSTYYGGDNFDVCASIHSDGTSIWLTGQAVSSNFPTANLIGANYFQAVTLGGNSAYVLQFDIASRDRLWSTYLGGSSSDFGWEIFNDGSFLWVIGETWSPDFPVVNNIGSGFFKPTLSGVSDAYISKFSLPSKTMEWSTYYGGNMTEQGRTIEVDNNFIWLGGITTSSDFFTLNTGGGAYFQNTLSGTDDGFLIKFDKQNQNLIYATYFGGNNSDITFSLTLNGNELFVTGTTTSTDFPIQTLGGNAFSQNTYGGGIDAFIFSMNKNTHALEWSTYLGGSFSERGVYIFSDANSIWCHGSTTSLNFPVFSSEPCNFFQDTYGGGGGDAYIFQLNKNTKELIYATYYGGGGNDAGFTGFSNNSSVWFSGQAGSINFPTQSSNSNDFFQSQRSGTSDAYILKFTDCGQTALSPTIDSISASQTTICSSSPATVTLSVNGSLNDANFWVWYADSCGGNPIDTGVSISVLVDTIKTFFVRGEGCCLSNSTMCQSITITFDTIVFSQTSTSLCFGDTLFLSSGQVVSQAGVFSDTLTAASGCDSISILNVTMFLPVIKDTFISICSGDSILVGTQYQFVSGIFSDTIFNGGAMGCDSIVRFNLTVSSTFDATILPFNNSLCGDTNILQLSAASPGGIWIGNGILDNISGVFSPLLSGVGTHQIVYLFSGSCGSSDTIFIEVFQGINVSSSISNETCSGAADGSINLSVSGGTGVLNFSWSNGASVSSIADLAPGMYEVTITDDNGCAFIQSFTITAAPPCCTLSATVDVVNTTCNAAVGSITINLDVASGTPPFEFSIDGGQNFSANNIFDNLGANTYDVLVRDTNNCEFSTSVAVIEDNNTILLNINTQNVSCFGFADGSIEVLVSGDSPPFSFLWNDNSTSDRLDDIVAGDYSVVVTDATGCQRTADITITEPALFSLDLGNDVSLCSDESIVLDASPGQLFEWSTGGTNASETVSQPGIVGVLVTDGNGCTATDTIEITQIALNLTATADTQIITELDTVQLSSIITGNSGTGIFEWTPSQSLSCSDCPNPLAFPRDTTLYQLVFTDDSGCSASDSILILVVPAKFNFFMPNAFSPNGDGENEIVFPIMNGVKQFTWRIYDRWGEKVFECLNSTVPCSWDGRFKGKIMDPNVFVWEAVVEFNEPSIGRYKGSLTLLK